MCRGAIGSVVLLALLASSTPAHALSIIGTYSALFAGPDNEPADGGGTIVDVFDAAARYWEEALLDDRTVTIPFGWTPGSQALAFYDGTAIHVSADNDWFVDATPETSAEYSTSVSSTARLNGVSINYGTGVRGALTAAAEGYDLFSVLLHEIGHALTFIGPNDAFPDYADGDVDVTAPRPLPGLVIPVANGCCHVGVPDGYTGIHPALFPFMDPGERRFISDVDLLFVAEGGQWERLDPARFAAVPEPPTMTLLGAAAAALAWRRRAAS